MEQENHSPFSSTAQAFATGRQDQSERNYGSYPHPVSFPADRDEIRYVLGAWKRGLSDASLIHCYGLQGIRCWRAYWLGRRAGLPEVEFDKSGDSC